MGLQVFLVRSLEQDIHGRSYRPSGYHGLAFIFPYSGCIDDGHKHVRNESNWQSSLALSSSATPACIKDLIEYYLPS